MAWRLVSGLRGALRTYAELQVGLKGEEGLVEKEGGSTYREAGGLEGLAAALPSPPALPVGRR